MDGGHNSVPDSRAEGDDTFPRMLVERVQVGEITLRHAEESARQSPADLSRPASRLAADAVRLARRDPWAAVVPGRIAAAAADSEEPVGDSEAAWIETNLAWVEIAARAVEVCPDARTQQHAAQRGERVRHWAKVRGSTEVQARACTLIAALVTRLHRVPPPLDYAELDRPDWATRILLYADERLATEMLKPGTFEFPENPLRPPPWEQAASAAEAHLREALAVEPSGSHGAPAELARLLRATGADPSEPGRLSYQALDMARGLCRAGILAFQRRLGVSIDFSSLAAELSEIGVEASVAELGQRDASRIAVEVLDCITDKLPEAALAWAQRWEPLVVATGDDSLTSVHWTLRASAAASALTSRVDRSGSSLDALAPEERLFVTAMAMLSANQSLPASNIFATLSQSAGDLVTAHPAAMMWMAIQSRMRGVMEGDSKDRLRLLPDVILGMINLGLRWWPLAVVSAVMRGLDQSASGTADLLVEFLERLVIPLERFHPEMARQFVHDIAGIVFSGRSDPVDRDHLIRLFQIAGGARYAAAVRAGALVNTAGDGECRTSLERARRWQEQQEAPTVKGPGDGDGNLLPEVFLTSYATGAEQSDGADTETVLGNVQMHADAVLDSRVLAAVASDSAPTLGLSELQAALDESTALLITFIGGPDSPTGHPSVLTALISQKTIAVAGIKWENLPGVMHHFEAPDGGFWLTSPMGMTVAELRRRVQEYPRPDVMSADAEEAFNDSGQIEQYLGRPVLAEMERLHKEGVNHLCVVPYGPLRVFPVHLLGAPGRMLADDWVVTYLPHPTLLRRQRSPSYGHRHPVTAVGISYARLGLADPGSAPVDTTSHARSVAELFGVEPLLDSRATRAAVTEALATSRRVHVAAHGEMNIRAPAFQALRLAPSESDDGRLCAADVLGLHLDGLELVTLSACESALVRFDHADNPRGLAPTLLLRGAGAVVGTLWPVKASVAETFFPALYGELNSDADVLDAYALALRKTRQDHPELRDWGAFYFLGDWRATPQRDAT